MTDTFSTLLQRLRIQRNLTQQALADAAEISLSAAYQAEAGKRSLSKRLATRVYVALHRRMPINAEDTAAFANLVGVDPFVLTGSLPDAERAAHMPKTLAAAGRFAPTVNREMAFYHQAEAWLARLLDADAEPPVNYEQLCHALIGVATTLGVRLPPPVSSTVTEALSFGGRPWPGAVAIPGTTIGDRTSVVYAPARPATTQPSPPPQSSRVRPA